MRIPCARIPCAAVLVFAACATTYRDPLILAERARMRGDLAAALSTLDAVPVRNARYPEARARALRIERQLRNCQELLLQGLYLRTEWRDQEAIEAFVAARATWPQMPGIEDLIEATRARMRVFGSQGLAADAHSSWAGTPHESLPPLPAGPAARAVVAAKPVALAARAPKVERPPRGGKGSDAPDEQAPATAARAAPEAGSSPAPEAEPGLVLEANPDEWRGPEARAESSAASPQAASPPAETTSAATPPAATLPPGGEIPLADAGRARSESFPRPGEDDGSLPAAPLAEPAALAAPPAKGSRNGPRPPGPEPTANDEVGRQLGSIEARFEHGDSEEAMLALEKLARLHPGDRRVGARAARVLHQRALLRYGRGDLRAAIEDWRRALRSDPSLEEARALLTLAEQELNKRRAKEEKAGG
ncbi:MAG: hypothetical protein Fur0037_06470 [Planctomycetota bacterium]